MLGTGLGLTTILARFVVPDAPPTAPWLITPGGGAASVIRAPSVASPAVIAGEGSATVQE